MTRANIEYDLSLARNKKGMPISDAAKDLIRKLIEHPTVTLWDQCCMIVLSMPKEGRPITLWFAVTMVDKTFPRKLHHDATGRRVWTKIPSAEVIEKAISLATH